MKFTTLFAVLATVVTAVSAINTNELGLRNLSNAERLAKRLPLKAPARRNHNHTPTYGAPNHYPSSVPPTGSCNSGPVQCCSSVHNFVDEPTQRRVKALVGVTVASTVGVAFSCEPLTTLGLGGHSCTSQTVCCHDNSFKGLVAIGCTPINVNLI